jgi:DNA-binding GntR family transcriptional regulator
LVTIANRLKLQPESRRLDSEPLSEQVYRVLRDAICDGLFEDHTHLVQGELAAQMNVSRTPVRDALLRLAQEKLVRAVGARGYIVEELSERDVLDIYEVRLTLEVQAAILALPNFGAADIRRLKEINDNINDPDFVASDPYDLNLQFHMAVIEPCPNRLMVKIIRDTWDQPMSRRIFRRQRAEHEGHAKLVDNHQAILAAVIDRDGETLETALTEHLMEARLEANRFLAVSVGDGAR